MRCGWILFAVGALAVRAESPKLAPPSDSPAKEVAPAKQVAPAKPAAPAPVEAKAAAAPPASTPALRSPDDIPDSIGAITIRPVPEPDEPEPAFLKQVDYLRAHNDPDMAASYLGKVVVNPGISERDRAQAILVLADLLGSLNRPAEELCWLKIWLQTYPQRQEIGAVAYRMGALYTRLGLSEPARDSYYLALSNAVNHGQVQNAADLDRYTRLTVGTLWALAFNEYQAGDWARAAELFDRYRSEAQKPRPGSLERAQYLQADCYYQLHDRVKAAAAYAQAVQDHPFCPLAPEGRLRLYHLDLMAKKPEQAEAELAALIWTVRTVWPSREAYWQQRTAELLLAVNHQDADALPPLVARASKLAAQDKAWQAELGHYDKLASLVATVSHDDMSHPSSSSADSLPAGGLSEQDDLQTMGRSIAALAPPRISVPPVPKNPTP